MNFLLPLTAIFGSSIAGAIDKINFRRNLISPNRLMRLVFLSMSLSVFVFIVGRGLPLPNFSSTALGLMGLIIVISFAANFFDFRSLKVNDVSSREPVLDLNPIIAGLFGYLLFPSEREVGFLVALILSGLVVYWGSYSKHRRKIRERGMFFALGAVLFYGLLPSLYKLMFEYFTPEYILLFRVLGVLALSMIFLSVKTSSRFSKNSVGLGLSSGIFFSIAGIASLYSIAILGLIVTMFFLLLGPALRYSIGFFVLKEKIHKREMVSSLLLVIIVSSTLLF